MSELINTNDNHATIRWKLLTGVSALALTAYISSANVVKAGDTDRPLVWVELGGQMDIMQGLGQPFTAPFMSAITPTPGPYSGDMLFKGQKPPRFGFGLDGQLSFQPGNSDWIFSASVRYGRSHANRHIHHQSPPPTRLYTSAFADIKTPYGERHSIVDFSVGRDVGIGALGHDGHSEISAGVRSVELSSDEDLTIHARPVVIVKHAFGGFPEADAHNYTMWASAERRFRGTGPSLAWDASAALAGNQQDGELALDWGVNAAVLFGRQKATTDHKTNAYVFGTKPPKYNNFKNLYYHPPAGSIRSRSVTVPNIGGHVGISMRYTDVKVSIGYRYDDFLKAMDTGIDVAKKSDLTFNGPYASISIGLGD